MQFESALDDIFLNRSHVRVLRALYRIPQGLAVSGREIARRAGLTHPTALKALAALGETGLTVVGRGPAGDAYELNRDHLFVEQIGGLYRIESSVREELIPFLQDQLLAVTDKVEWATLFGSAAWGGSKPSSDLDLAVSCARSDVEEVEVALEFLSAAAHRRFGSRVGPLINSRKQRPRVGIWKRIEEEGIPLIRSGKGVL